jgi:hypothetical protein
LARTFISRYNGPVSRASSGGGQILAGENPALVSHLKALSHEGKSFMTTCERCNTDNLDGSQYCDECGAPLGGAASNRKNSIGTGNSGGPTNSKSMADVQPVVAASESVAHRTSTSFAVSASALRSTDGAHANLIIERGRSAGKQFSLCEEESQIGRWDADGGIFPDVDLDSDDPEAKVSRRHARIMRRNAQYFIEDLGSTNGTFINRGRRLLPGDRQPLRDGDEIIVGKTFLRFHIIK